jgi:hypothetical protein
VRLTWTSKVCLSKGSSQGIDQVTLRVRIGLLDRAELIQLLSGWYLSGPSAPEIAAHECV